ncbi:Glucose-6-phosphate isomerase [Clarias magur]|uniref:Glucose-6-phosphate isomerase n=1 Tax=Clarias magur TaxID=1594786 RepID=A0A8J4UMU7_CLAMG|nr:Glucose-6-phosphate isomerase [Clarias magur]
MPQKPSAHVNRTPTLLSTHQLTSLSLFGLQAHAGGSDQLFFQATSQNSALMNPNKHLRYKRPSSLQVIVL